MKNHISPQTTTGYSPSELLFSRRLRSALTLLRPDQNSKIRMGQMQEPKATRELKVGDPVLALNFGQGDKWLTGQVHRVLGATNYAIRLQNGQELHRHIDQLWKTVPSMELEVQQNEPPSSPQPVALPGPSNGDCSPVPDVPAEVLMSHPPEPVVVATPTAVMEPRRSSRVRQMPARLKDYGC